MAFFNPEGTPTGNYPAHHAESNKNSNINPLTRVAAALKTEHCEPDTSPEALRTESKPFKKSKLSRQQKTPLTLAKNRLNHSFQNESYVTPTEVISHQAKQSQRKIKPPSPLALSSFTPPSPKEKTTDPIERILQESSISHQTSREKSVLDRLRQASAPLTPTESPRHPHSALNLSPRKKSSVRQEASTPLDLTPHPLGQTSINTSNQIWSLRSDLNDTKVAEAYLAYRAELDTQSSSVYYTPNAPVRSVSAPFETITNRQKRPSRSSLQYWFEKQKEKAARGDLDVSEAIFFRNSNTELLKETVKQCLIDAVKDKKRSDKTLQLLSGDHLNREALIKTAQQQSIFHDVDRYREDIINQLIELAKQGASINGLQQFLDQYIQENFKPTRDAIETSDAWSLQNREDPSMQTAHKIAFEALAEELKANLNHIETLINTSEILMSLEGEAPGSSSDSDNALKVSILENLNYLKIKAEALSQASLEPYQRAAEKLQEMQTITARTSSRSSTRYSTDGSIANDEDEDELSISPSTENANQPIKALNPRDLLELHRVQFTPEEILEIKDKYGKNLLRLAIEHRNWPVAFRLRQLGMDLFAQDKNIKFTSFSKIQISRRAVNKALKNYEKNHKILLGKKNYQRLKKLSETSGEISIGQIAYVLLHASKNEYTAQSMKALLATHLGIETSGLPELQVQENSKTFIKELIKIKLGIPAQGFKMSEQVLEAELEGLFLKLSNPNSSNTEIQETIRFLDDLFSLHSLIEINQKTHTDRSLCDRLTNLKNLHTTRNLAANLNNQDLIKINPINSINTHIHPLLDRPQHGEELNESLVMGTGMSVGFGTVFGNRSTDTETDTDTNHSIIDATQDQSFTDRFSFSTTSTQPMDLENLTAFEDLLHNPNRLPSQQGIGCWPWTNRSKIRETLKNQESDFGAGVGLEYTLQTIDLDSDPDSNRDDLSSITASTISTPHDHQAERSPTDMGKNLSKKTETLCRIEKNIELINALISTLKDHAQTHKTYKFNGGYKKTSELIKNNLSNQNSANYPIGELARILLSNSKNWEPYSFKRNLAKNLGIPGLEDASKKFSKDEQARLLINIKTWITQEIEKKFLGEKCSECEVTILAIEKVVRQAFAYFDKPNGEEKAANILNALWSVDTSDLQTGFNTKDVDFLKRLSTQFQHKNKGSDTKTTLLATAFASSRWIGKSHADKQMGFELSNMVQAQKYQRPSVTNVAHTAIAVCG